MTNERTPVQRAFRLLICVACLLVIWLGLLPWIGSLPAVERHLQTLRDSHIDAGVMFYSELDPRVLPDRAAVKEFLRSRHR